MAELSEWITYCAIALLLIAGIISITSLIRFKSILIKLVIIEVLTNLLTAGIALWALIYKKSIFIDICLPLSLIMFLGVVAYYQYLLGKDNHHANFNQ